MITRRDEKRGWRINKASGEKEPVYSDYPTEGYDISLLYKEGDLEFYQIADYANKRRIYNVFVGDKRLIETTNRQEASIVFDQAKEGARE